MAGTLWAKARGEAVQRADGAQFVDTRATGARAIGAGRC